jgi:hypothetical protein
MHFRHGDKMVQLKCENVYGEGWGRSDDDGGGVREISLIQDEGAGT